jgi:hypothetical protein
MEETAAWKKVDTFRLKWQLRGKITWITHNKTHRDTTARHKSTCSLTEALYKVSSKGHLLWKGGPRSGALLKI